MIKINLAKRKQAAFAGAGSSAGTNAAAVSGMKKFTLDLDRIRDLPLKKAVLPLVLAFAISWIADDLKRQEMVKAEAQLKSVQEIQAKLKVEAGKMKQYEALKKALEEDEKTIRAKLDIIEKLIGDRKTPFLILRSLSTAIPTGVWLSEFKIQGAEASFKGSAIELRLVSEFIKNLNETVYFNGSVKFKDIKPEGGLANFELTASRK
jgi:type IV pilus assembly protein PilN